MRHPYSCIRDAKLTFDGFVALEPRLEELWYLCERATPPIDDGDPDADPFAVDPFAATHADDGWCSEQYFFERVKSKLVVLVGTHRPGGPHPLIDVDAYEQIYDLLLNWALNRCCSCCAADGVDDADEGAFETSMELR